MPVATFRSQCAASVFSDASTAWYFPGRYPAPEETASRDGKRCTLTAHFAHASKVAAAIWPTHQSHQASMCVCVGGRRVSHAENAVLVSFSRVLQGDVQASMPKLTPLDPLKQPSPAPAPLPISGKSSTTPAMPQVTPRACSATYQLGHNVRYYSGHKAKDCKPGNMPTKLSSLPLAPQDCSSCPTFS